MLHIIKLLINVFGKEHYYLWLHQGHSKEQDQGTKFYIWKYEELIHNSYLTDNIKVNPLEILKIILMFFWQFFILAIWKMPLFYYYLFLYYAITFAPWMSMYINIKQSIHIRCMHWFYTKWTAFNLEDKSHHYPGKCLQDYF